MEVVDHLCRWSMDFCPADYPGSQGKAKSIAGRGGGARADLDDAMQGVVA